MTAFISHCSRDKSLIREILAELKPIAPTWLDERDLLLGMDITHELRSAIWESDFVLVFLSEASITSDWVKKELRWAIKRERELNRTFLLPVLLDDVLSAVRPRHLQSRRFLKCLDRSAFAIRACAQQLAGELSQWYDTLPHNYPANLPKGDGELTGTWRSRFTWDDGAESSSHNVAEVIEVVHSGNQIVGRSIASSSKYTFDGHIVDGYILGNWRNTRLPLFGTFMLRTPDEFSNGAIGGWIGNSSSGIYQGTWGWEPAG